ncbi:MAG: M20/M25/M40 family metallo-hydrolase [Chloroflexi bacterium]|nr:M20/M25/M40 family metallo-hydrolase [Chloroflexota bacterium]
MRNWTKILTVIILLMLATLACNLTADAPPTLAPRAPQSTLTPANPFGPQATILPPPVTHAPLPQGYTTSLPSSPNITVVLNQVDSQRMISDIQALVGFGNRYSLYEPAANEGIFAAQQWITSQLEAIQATYPNTLIQVWSQSFPIVNGSQIVQNNNIVMVINGTDAQAGVVALGAHYDTISVTNNPFQPGANDNGSGVAAALEIARIMAQRPHRATLVFVFFAGEELQRNGSLSFARDYIHSTRIPLVATINLDMIGNPTGLNGNRYDYQMRAYSAPENDSESRALARLTEMVARGYVPNMVVNVMDSLDRQGRWGDHQSFSDLGYPAIRLIEQEDNLSLVHNPNDTLTNIDSNYLRRTTQVTLATLQVLADGPNPPTLRQMDTSTWTLEWSPVQNAVSYMVALRSPGSLKYDMHIMVQDTRMSWAGFPGFEAVAVAAIDANGLLGRFSQEQRIQTGPVE